MELDYSFLNDKAKEVFEDYLHHETELLLEGAKNTKSPIEQILWVALVSIIKELNFYPTVQTEFELNGKRYIADIAIEVPGTIPDYVCIIECDGHDYHERTKEQAMHDRARDRAFQAAGIPVFRFTGSEIYNNPFGCAGEVKRFLRKLI